MFKLIDKKNGYGEYIIVRNKILCSTKKGLIYGYSIVYKPKNKYISFFKTYNNNVYLFENKKGLVYFDLMNYRNIKEIDFIDGIDYFINENDVIVTRLSDDYLSSDKIRINLDTLEKRWEIKSYFGSGKIFNDAIFAVCSGGKICKISLSNPQTPLWKFDLSQFGTSRYGGDDIPYNVIHFLGVWQGKLLVQLAHNRLIALDIHTGELLNDTNSMQFTAFPTSSYMKMHLLGDTVHWLYVYGYAQIDLHTFKVELKRDFTEIPEEQRLYISQSTLFQNKLYFVTSPFDCFSSDTIGVFDIAKNDIIWHKNLSGILEKGDSLRNEAPKVTADKLYIPTSKAKLFIFEKTSNENV